MERPSDRSAPGRGNAGETRIRFRSGPPGDEDDTVRIRPGRIKPPAAAATARPAILGLLAAGLIGLGGLAWLLAWLLWPAAPSAPRPLAMPAPPPVAVALHAPMAAAPAPTRAVVAPPAAAPSIPTATQAQILDDKPAHLRLFRFAANPDILVLDFPSLEAQGLMFDRIAALVEKAGLPRDRVVPWAALKAHILAGGDTIGTYYYGDDYSAAALARFFALAAAEGRTLNPEEARLRALLDRLGWLRPGVQAGLITLPAEGADAHVTRRARDTILTHELSHGEFFSRPAYAGFVARFWRTALSPPQRAGVRGFLAREGYDVTQHELVVNEMQAYLMFTRAPEFFRAADIGMTPAERTRLQRVFHSEMPAGWLRERLGALNAQGY